MGSMMGGLADSAFGEAVDSTVESAGNMLSSGAEAVGQGLKTGIEGLDSASKLALNYMKDKTDSFLGNKVGEVKQEYQDMADPAKADAALKARKEDYDKRQALAKEKEEKERKEQEELDFISQDNAVSQSHQNNMQAMNNMLQKGLQVQNNG